MAVRKRIRDEDGVKDEYGMIDEDWSFTN